MTTALFEQQHHDLNELLSTLSEELEAISSRDHQALSNAVERKSSLLSQITQRDQQLATCIDPSLPEHKEWITRLNELLAECKKKNDVNHVAANQSLIASNKLKEIFFGKSQSSYDRSGKAFSLPKNLAKGIKA